jgi:hypothetical protein
MEISHFYLMGQSICNSSLTLSCSLLPLQQLGLNLFNRSHTITPSFLCKSEIDIRQLASLTKIKAARENKHKQLINEVSLKQSSNGKIKHL